jgi:peptide/nickel transport system permease protein
MAIDSAPAAAEVLDDTLATGVAEPSAPRVTPPGRRPRRRVSRLAAAASGMLVIAGVFGPEIARNPTRVHLFSRLQPPVGFGGTWAHPLGTDGLGRDMVANLFAGARVSLMVGVGAVVLASLIGIPLGLWAGYRGGLVDSAVSWAIDFQLGFPALLLILLISAYVRAGVVPLIVMLGLVTWMLFARLARSLALSLRNSDFVAGARLSGSSTFKILRRHLLPNMQSPLITLALLEVATAMLGESALSYLGYGISRPNVSWGLMIAEGQPYLRIGWWIITFPGAMLTIAVVSFHGLARSVRPAGAFTRPPR